MKNKVTCGLFLVFTGIIALLSCQGEDVINYKRYYINGKGLYEKHCQGCHGSKGEGLGTLYPPLTDSIYLMQNKSKLACIIKYGQSGQITVNNTDFDGQMPGNKSLADIDIAQIIVYVTNSFGNSQHFYDAAEVTSDLAICN